MDMVGSEYVCLSDECWQDVGLSLWSDTWTVGDPVSVPLMNYDDEFSHVFGADQVQSSDDCSDWLSDVMMPVSPNSVAGHIPPLFVMTSGEHEQLNVCADDCDGVVSPTDSGHGSTASCAAAAPEVIGDAPTDGDDVMDAADEHTCELNSPLDVHVKAECRDAAVENPSKEMDSKSRAEEAEFVTQRCQRVAARNAAVALARESTDCDDDDDDDEDDVDDTRLRSRRHLQATEMTSSRRGRSRAAEVNRNALNARINREKKKAYITSLEAQKTRLLDENKRMKSALSSLLRERNGLVDEVKYLKSVLANDSVLAKLVEGINGPPLKLSSRFDGAAEKRKDIESDHNYGPTGQVKVARVSAGKVAGICLHVTENQLSMEFCHHCSDMANSGQKDV